MSAERIDPAEAAREIFRGRYSGARVLFLAGSVLRGEATPTSDLDIVVVYDRLPHARREAFLFAGWPVEAFVHDPETLRHFFHSERKKGVPSLMRMVIEGVEIPRPCEFSAGLKNTAARLYDEGPPHWRDDDLHLMRYRLTDWCDDIRHPRSPEELVASGTYLYQDVADFFFRSRNLWSAHSKTIPRRLAGADAAFAGEFARAFEALFAEKKPGPVIALVEKMLEPHGGLLFDGFRKDALPTERLPPDAPPEEGP